MKSSHLISLSIYVFCIIVGFKVGNILKYDEITVTTPDQVLVTPTSIPTLKNGQHNLLVVITDDLTQSHPQLASIWLVTYFLDNPSITFLPIYPTISNGSVLADEKLFDSFEIIPANGQSSLSMTFLDTLTQRNFWWSGYLIVDRQAFSWVLEPQAGISPDILTNYYDQNYLIQAEVIESPESIYVRDTQIMRDTCDQVAQQGANLNWEVLRNLFPQHISTDLDVNTVIGEWISSLSSNGAPLCNFPLEMVSP